MRNDITILWIDDSETWQKEQQEILEMKTYSYGLITKYEYVEDAERVIYNIENENTGFSKYDIIFVDYNISQKISGNQLIDKIRTAEISADILFYSANTEADLKNILFTKSGEFEGVYIASRENFTEKAVKLYKKNVKNLLSLSSMRGFLMDKTSEIDFIMQSYILNCFDNLDEETKNEIIRYINEKASIINDQHKENFLKLGNYIEKKYNIKKILGLPSDIIPLKVKYGVFDLILKAINPEFAEQLNLNVYLDSIVTKRNKLAHKKLDICKKQSYIKYSDNTKQLIERECPDDCDLHNDENKISLEEWRKIIVETNNYSRLFDQLLNEILTESKMPALK